MVVVVVAMRFLRSKSETAAGVHLAEFPHRDMEGALLVKPITNLSSGFNKDLTSDS